MKALIITLVVLALPITSCDEAPSDVQAYEPRTGNPSIDGFIRLVQKHDEEGLDAAIGKFKTISGVEPQFKTAAEYLDWTNGCKISWVGQMGLDASDNPVLIDRTLTSGPSAVRVLSPENYDIYWDCEKGKFRQTLNAEFEAPRMMVSEMRARARELPVMKPPVS